MAPGPPPIVQRAKGLGPDTRVRLTAASPPVASPRRVIRAIAVWNLLSRIAPPDSSFQGHSAPPEQTVNSRQYVSPPFGGEVWAEECSRQGDRSRFFSGNFSLFAVKENPENTLERAEEYPRLREAVIGHRLRPCPSPKRAACNGSAPTGESPVTVSAPGRRVAISDSRGG